MTVELGLGLVHYDAGITSREGIVAPGLGRLTASSCACDRGKAILTSNRIV